MHSTLGPLCDHFGRDYMGLITDQLVADYEHFKLSQFPEITAHKTWDFSLTLAKMCSRISSEFLVLNKPPLLPFPYLGLLLGIISSATGRQV